MDMEAHGDTVDRPDAVLDVIVIGGGQAGLAMAWHLREGGARFLVLDAGPRVGHAWRSRWDSLTLFTPAQYDGLPGMDFPAPADTYPDKDQVADYLEAYAAAFDLPVRLNSRVTELRRTGEHFQVRTAGQTFSAHQVVVATGAFAQPFVPSLADRLDPAVTQLHSSQYRNPRDLPDGPIVVVGAGNSGMQIAAELVASRPVDLSVGANPTVLPQRLLGRDLFWWLTKLRLLGVAGSSRLGRRMRSRGEFVIGTSRRQLGRAGVDLRARLADADGKTVRFADGTAQEVSGVIWATGFRAEHSWLRIPGVLRDGRVVHQRGATEVPGLYFLGLSWQHTRGSALLGFVAADAAHLAERLAMVRHAPAPPAETGRR
jgi:putative flavoprotein involved in K+ transport